MGLSVTANWNPPNRKRRRTTSEDEQQQREHTPENQMSYKEVEQKRKDRQRRGWVWIGLGVCAAIAFSGFRIIRPNRLGLVEIFGKYTRTAEPGLRWIPPRPIGRMLKVPMDVQHIEIPGQQIITSEQLNAQVDAVVYYQIRDAVKAIYNVDDYASTVPILAQTTLRNVLGKYTLSEANSRRGMINATLKKELHQQIDNWGMNVLNVELKAIAPTSRVQQSMNNIIIAEQGKLASEFEAHAAEIQADGKKRAAIKDAEAKAKAVLLAADALGEAIRIKAKANAAALSVEAKAVQEVATPNVMFYWRLKTTETALRDNTTVLLPPDKNGIWNVLDIARMTSEQQQHKPTNKDKHK